MKKILLWIMTVLCAGAIFFFSSQEADVSRKTGEGFTKDLFSLFAPFKNLPGETQKEIIEGAQGLVRTLAHFSLFAALGFFGALLAAEYGFDRRRALVAVLIFCAVYAISDEIHQLFVRGRSAQIRDVVTDECGALVGALAARAFGKKRKQG